MWAGELRVLVWGFSKCPRRVFPTKTRRILDRIILTAAGLFTDPKSGYSQHRGDLISIVRAGHRQESLSWQWVPVLFSAVSQVTWEDCKQKMGVIFGNSLFKESLASRKSSKTSALGKRRLFWLKIEAQRRVKVGKLPERRKAKWIIIMNINQPQAGGCQVKPVASRAEGNRDVLFRYKRLKVVV